MVLVGILVLTAASGPSDWFSPFALAAYVLLVILLERRNCSELCGGALGLGEFCLGALIGCVWVGLPCLLLVAFDGYHIPSIHWATVVLAVPAAFAALVEEPLNRGLILRYAELRLGGLLALVVATTIFVLEHMLDRPLAPGALLTPALLGLAAGAAFLLTRRLWMSIGIHMSLNAGAVLLSGGTAIIHGGTLVSIQLVVALIVAGGFVTIAHRRGALSRLSAVTAV
jgi:membrane protease YdiL (CAAX protease family)